MTTFTWAPDAGASMACTPAVDAAKFGDGYEQRAADGLNSQMRTWSLKFSRHVAEVLDFVEQGNGAASFAWTDPLGRNGLFVCRKWSVSHSGLFSLSCEFEQVTG